MSVLLSHETIVGWLRETDTERLGELWHAADECRRINVGDEVHLRGLVEISNHCIRLCGYCGLRAGGARLERYRMTETEIIACAQRAASFGYGTVVLQSGEDYGLTAEWVAKVVTRIKRETGLAVTLSLGERPPAELRLWREAGADRYLLRFETSDPGLYAVIHPGRDGAPGHLHERLELLRCLREWGYEIGSGVMVGIPGQTVESLAADLELFRALDLDMIGIGPFIAHPATPLGSSDTTAHARTVVGDQASNDELTVCKMLALARLACPAANIPSTTALATINKQSGHEQGLGRGANVIMPNLTPPSYRVRYEVYPDKASVDATSDKGRASLTGRIEALGRRMGSGPGGRRRP